MSRPSQVWAAYDEDGNQLDAPAEGTVLRVGIYGRMYETREDATVLWLGGAPVVLPLAGELEDVAAGYVVLANAEGLRPADPGGGSGGALRLDREALQFHGRIDRPTVFLEEYR